jgi:outer membrane receptor for ferrienterochelin and colicins
MRRRGRLGRHGTLRRSRANVLVHSRPLLSLSLTPLISACVLALGLAGYTSQARAEEIESVEGLDLVKLLNVEVSTASKTAESLSEAPAVITVVTREDIQRWGFQSVAEVLSHTVGFYLTDDHILPNVGVRGMSGGLGAESGVIKVMIDGISVAYRSTSGNWLGVELIPLESIAQIEIIRGPASALYGADAFLGVVNIITLKPEQMRPIRARVAAGVTEGNPGGRFDVVAGTSFGKIDVLLGVAGEYTDRSGLALPGESPAPTLPSYVGDRRTTLDLSRRSLVAQARVGYRDVDNGHLILSAYASGIERGGDFAHWAQLSATADQGGREYGTVVALGQLRSNLDGLLHVSDSLDLALTASYFQGGVLPADRVEIASDLFYVEREASYRGVNTVGEARFTASSRFNLIAGFEAVYDREKLGEPQRIDRITDQPVFGTSANKPAVNLMNLGTYLSANYKAIDPWLKLTGGVRYDHHTVYGEQLTGRVGVTSRWTEALVAKLLYGRAFKAPSPYLSYASPLRPGDVVGNRNLEPQRIHTIEYQMSFDPHRFFGVTSGVSYNWLLDKAEFTPSGINQTARNVSSQRSLSWETRADLRHHDDYTAYACFELVRSLRQLGQEGYAARLIGSENVVYPPWIARAGVSFAVPSIPDVPLELAAQAKFVARRRAADTSILERGGDFSLPSYFMLDASLATREVYLVPGHESRFAVRIRNLFAERGPDPGFSGFEYPLGAREIFLEIEHTY